MIRNILKMGNPILREKTKELTESEVLTKEFKHLIRDMFDTMKKADGVGLAAPQIGILKQVFVMGTEREKTKYEEQTIIDYKVIINPKIKFLTKELSQMWEGCLSIPNIRGIVQRPKKIEMTWRDQKWNSYVQVIDGFEAVVCQHEYDHLQGILYVDKLKDTRFFGFNDSIVEK